MHESFADFIRHGQSLAEQKELKWEFDVDTEGRASIGWNLTELVGGLPPVSHLRDLGQDDKILQLINDELTQAGSPILPKTPLGKNWQDLIKAATCDQLFFRRNTPGHVSQNIIRPIKILATCAGALEPWLLTVDAIREAYAIAKQSQPSGQLADRVLGATKSIIDANHLAVNGPLYPLVSISRLTVAGSTKSRASKSKEQLLNDLDQRKRAERLPEKRAFWELTRIIFTEEPKSFSDALRFAMLKTMVLCGLRLGEAVLLPMDWKRYREYYDTQGRPAGELGGYSQSLMLRHFAEKQQSEDTNSTTLFEATQPIPEIFSEILTDTLDEVIRITDPLRKMLRMQVETGRLFPWHQPSDLVPLNEIYTRLTGNPFSLNVPEETIERYVKRYRQGFNPLVLDELAQDLNSRHSDSTQTFIASSAMYIYFKRLCASTGAPILRYEHGGEAKFNRVRSSSNQIFMRIGELEDYIKKALPTKLPTLKPLKLQNGELQPWEMLFLAPKRSLAEERNDGITDITRYFAPGVPNLEFMMEVLGIDKGKRKSIFEIYGLTDEDRRLVLKSHSLRHLQNTELFRLGVADTIITKRFNRRSVAQSYDYDHRSLAEELESIELPPDVEASLGAKSSTVARLIKAGKATGPIVTSFKRIQKELGDEAAFDFLKVESDGFHATPYGHCINSFTVDPCPKNLECFAGCCHLTATGLPENRRHLENLEGRLQAALSEASSRPANSIGKANQVSHATVRLNAVRKLLATPPGEHVFPDGPDLSLPSSSRSVLDG